MNIKLYDYLKENAQGAGSAIKYHVLGEIFDLGWREIACEVQELRQAGYGIASSRKAPFGAYLPVSRSEIKECLRTFGNAAFSALRTYKAMEKNFDREIVKEVQEEFSKAKQQEFHMEGM